MSREADAWIRDKHYTTEHLEIIRLSGSPLPMDRCYINLILTDQHRKHLNVSSNGEGEGLPSSSSPFSLEARLNIETPCKEDLITLPKLFDQRERLHGNKQRARRIFIRGRAGVGKTTLCKKCPRLYQRRYVAGSIPASDLGSIALLEEHVRPI